jgi:hypothetical protein
MQRSIDDSPKLVCVPDAIPAAERAGHFALGRRLFTELTAERADLPNGYAFRFAPNALEDVARFVANERRCCPFMSFEFVLAPEAGPLWLRMSGPDGTREVMRAELGLSTGCGCE